MILWTSTPNRILWTEKVELVYVYGGCIPSDWQESWCFISDEQIVVQIYCLVFFSLSIFLEYIFLEYYFFLEYFLQFLFFNRNNNVFSRFLWSQFFSSVSSVVLSWLIQSKFTLASPVVFAPSWGGGCRKGSRCGRSSTAGSSCSARSSCLDSATPCSIPGSWRGR